MKNRLFILFLISAVLFSVNVFAENTANVIIDGNEIIYDQKPVIENGRILVPMRATFEALGAEIEWDNAAKTVKASNESNKISIQIGAAEMKIDGKSILLDVPAKIINGRTLVPLRAVSEAFNADIDWINETKTVYITTMGAVNLIDYAADENKNETDYYKEYKADDGTVLFSESYKYDKLDNDIDSAVRNKIHAEIEEECKKLIESSKNADDAVTIVDYAKRIYEAYYNAEQPTLFTEYSNVVTFSITENSDKYISYLGSNYLYTGGAHGDGIIICKTFDKKTGENVTASDVLGISEDAVKMQMLEKFREKINNEPDLFFYDALENLEETVNENCDFYISGGKPKFIITVRYAIAPYSSGYIETDAQ